MRGDRAARPHRGAGLLRRAPTGTRSPRSSTTSTSRCSATATSGRPPTRSAWSSRPVPPASSSAAAAWAGRGCSATWPPRSPARGRHAADARRGRGDDAPPRRAAQRAHGRGARLQGVPQARVVVPQGLPRRGELRHSLALVDSLASLDALLAELDPDEPFPVAELGAPRGRQGSPRARVVLPEGWLDDTDGTGRHVREDTTEPRAADRGHPVTVSDGTTRSTRPNWGTGGRVLHSGLAPSWSHAVGHVPPSATAKDQRCGRPSPQAGHQCPPLPSRCPRHHFVAGPLALVATLRRRRRRPRSRAPRPGTCSSPAARRPPAAGPECAPSTLRADLRSSPRRQPDRAPSEIEQLLDRQARRPRRAARPTPSSGPPPP